MRHVLKALIDSWQTRHVSLSTGSCMRHELNGLIDSWQTRHVSLSTGSTERAMSTSDYEHCMAQR